MLYRLQDLTPQYLVLIENKVLNQNPKWNAVETMLQKTTMLQIALHHLILANHMLSILPVHAHFNSNKYKTKKPIPSNNIYVPIKGFLDAINTDSSGRATTFHVSVDNINFLGKLTLFLSAMGNTGNFFYSLFVFMLNTITQLHLHLRIHSILNSILMPLLWAHQPTLPFSIPSLQHLNMVYWHEEERKENSLHLFVLYQ